ncbi:NAD(+) diphosphatase [Corynebacterium frankenforstense]|uniref:NAD(+) diphosphatase n=1 Tax=Corynebacterium frankenforstense TaxID=1230998 RepID=UPI00254F8AE4|nr:NUDIX domain-containing protein [Corynebacterium frankenforstense]MDK6260897.1 NUDIX domain-containing protein [Corynebacterium frankenforstense]
MIVYLPVDPDGRFPVAAGRPVYFTAPEVVDHHRAGWLASGVRPGEVVVFRAEADAVAAELARPGVSAGTARAFAADPVVGRALALLRNRERVRFDPLDGSELTYADPEGRVGTGAGGHEVFPRISPAVIGAVIHTGADGEPEVLLAQNRRRPGYHSLIAGYVEAGETLEAAFAREVHEETGRRVRDVRYWGSQPWPVSGSLMVGMVAHSDDREAVAAGDGEVFDIRWATRAQLGELTLPAPGSIALRMLDAFAAGELA